MAGNVLLTPTLHIEVLLNKEVLATPQGHGNIRADVAEKIKSNYAMLQLGKLDDFPDYAPVHVVDVADFTGPNDATGYYKVSECALDVQTYILRSDKDAGERRSMSKAQDNDVPQARIVALPNAALTGEWDSLVFDDALPARLLRYLVRMLAMMNKPGLNLATFNWNRLCLLHGPPGSGKSTLCRALAQKLSIRLGDIFTTAALVEINSNAMLSKYFGESGKLIESTFDKVVKMSQNRLRLVVVVIDEVETIAGSRRKASNNGECNDGLRATNQLLTALDRLRTSGNVIVCCTSNLIEAIDPAFLDRVDIKQHVPCPSPSAIYNIFRSCLNELVRSTLIDAPTAETPGRSPTQLPVNSSPPYTNPAKKRRTTRSFPSAPPASNDPSSEFFTILSMPEIPTLATTQVALLDQPDSPGQRIWALAQKCEGFSGRTLRRLPILGLAMYTWGGKLALEDAVAALEQAVEQELLVGKGMLAGKGVGPHVKAERETEVSE